VTVWAFDLDGTLIGSIRNDRLRPGARELLVALAERGVTCVLWSAGGAAYAERKAREHGIADAFVAFYAKAERDLDQRYRIDHFAPEHRPDVFVDDSPRDVTSGARVIRVPQFMGGNDADRSLRDLLELQL
jgi:phosphoglycolate phosphatase-like HAD superfamily hydrolase